jgi:hypothetical protein
MFCPIPSISCLFPHLKNGNNSKDRNNDTEKESVTAIDDVVVPTRPNQHLIDESLTLLYKHNIKLVIFDLDLTAVNKHSQGRLKRSRIHEFTSYATKDFITLVPALHKANFKLAIATHSDEEEFYMKEKRKQINRETHILGEELVTVLLKTYFDSDIVSSFYVVAYNPRAHNQTHNEQNKIKRYHMRKIIECYQMKPNEILFFDDTNHIIKDCQQHFQIIHSYQVNPKYGFRLQQDLINNLK